MPRVTTVKACEYDGHQYRPGQTFQIPQAVHVQLYVALGYVRTLPEEAVALPPAVSSVASVPVRKRQYKRRDLTAEAE